MLPLVERIVQGDARAAARLLRNVDDRVGTWFEALADLFPHTGRAHVVGITGNPGAGKSTLTDRLITHYRASGGKVGVVAVDPTSPFTGGAILGDRIRMQRHALDDGVFIRSLATRGQLGGVSRSTMDSVHVLDAWGASVVLVETVGVGQDELDVARLAHTTVVVVPPGLGDEIQAIKAGILEIADVFCVNKADRDGAEATVRDLETMLAMNHEMFHAQVRAGRHHGARAIDLASVAESLGEFEWLAPIVKTVAMNGSGVAELAAAIEKHRVFLSGTNVGVERMRARARDELWTTVRAILMERATDRIGDRIDAASVEVLERKRDPYTIARELVDELVETK